MYPKDTSEVEKFVSGIIQSLHTPKSRDIFMKQLTSEQVPVAARVGSVVANVISSMLQRVKKQGGGRKPHLNLILKSIKLAVVEVSKMAEIAGVDITPEEQKEAAKIAGDMIESGEMAQQAPQEQQQHQQMQPQAQQPQQAPGLIGGVQNG